jgi:DNA mismatch endonuclease (patch repair protein)
MDRITPKLRSRNMSRIKSKNTKPEVILRKLLYSRGYRYRIQYILPGKPDIVFVKKKIAIFVNGCFWHGHENCRESHVPKTNSKFWEDKILKNKARDFKNINKLKEDGWNVLTFWECNLEKDPENEIRKLKQNNLTS